MTDLIRYQLHENGLHEFTFLEKNRASVDEFYRQMQSVYDSTAETQTIRLIVDFSLPGIIPMQYMFREGQNMRRRNKRNVPIRLLILHPEKGILPIARIFINSIIQLRGTYLKLRLEPASKREEALEWLLGDKS